MTETNQFELSNHNEATELLSTALCDKLEYLQALHNAVKQQDDRLVYQLIDQDRYALEILQQDGNLASQQNQRLIADIGDRLAIYLSGNLIDYLRKRYPFFYFEEVGLGQFKIYFGNWWGRRFFGTLDVLNVRFDFEATEYQKLAQSFALEKENKMLNTDKIGRLSAEIDELQTLIDEQNKRDQQKESLRQEIKRNSQEKVMPWESGRQKEERQKLVAQLSILTEIDEKAAGAYKQIRENQDVILKLSKEDTLIGYEKQSIVAKFGDFATFEEANRVLYRDYLTDLIARQRRGE